MVTGEPIQRSMNWLTIANAKSWQRWQQSVWKDRSPRASGPELTLGPLATLYDPWALTDLSVDMRRRQMRLRGKPTPTTATLIWSMYERSPGAIAPCDVLQSCVHIGSYTSRSIFELSVLLFLMQVMYLLLLFSHTITIWKYWSRQKIYVRIYTYVHNYKYG